jgi:hypothetical protein
MKCSVHVPFPGYTNLPNYIPGKGHTQRQQITKQMDSANNTEFARHPADNQHKACGYIDSLIKPKDRT